MYFPFPPKIWNIHQWIMVQLIFLEFHLLLTTKRRAARTQTVQMPKDRKYARYFPVSGQKRRSWAPVSSRLTVNTTISASASPLWLCSHTNTACWAGKTWGGAGISLWKTRLRSFGHHLNSERSTAGVCHHHERPTGLPDVRGSGVGNLPNRSRGGAGFECQSNKREYQERR